MVRDQMAEWRQARRPIPQPAATAIPASGERRHGGAESAAVAGRDLKSSRPPDRAGRAGTQSGINAEGEGDMLATEQLTLTKENLAAREAEVQELRAQVAELEKLQQQQSS